MAKGKRWAKGQSSSSNPTNHKYRDIAKNNRSFFSFGLPSATNASNKTEKSQLTRKALAELDSMSIGANKQNDQDETKSMISESDADSFRSWATNWSDCTNATFNKVHKYWRSNSAFHKEILAVLAAITEVIKENNGKESETEYMAALMTGMESVESNQESSAAFLYLIALAIKKVPENVLRAKHTDLIRSLTAQLDKYGSAPNNVTLVKSCLKCLCWILKSLGKQEWSNKSTVKCYMRILEYVQDERPKIRKCGQEAVRLVLNSCASSIDEDAKSNHETVSSLTADYCLDLIMNDNRREDEKEADNESKKETLKSKNQRILHILTLFKHTIHHYAVRKLKSIGECLLRLMTLKDVLLTSSCFQIFNELFNSERNHLNAELNAQIINAFYDYQPSENDPNQLIGWLAVIESALRSLNRLNKSLCLSHLPHYFQTVMLALISHHKNVQVMATNCMTKVLEQCVQTNIQLFIDDMRQSIDLKKSLLHKIFSSIEAGLGYQYHMCWIFVMKVLACAFTSFKSRETFPVVQKCLSSLGNLRESEQFTYKKEADLAIGRAIQTYGPKLMLDCIPLNITGNETSYEYPRSWMLPLLRDFIEKTELSFFINTLLPLANKLRTKSKQFLDSNQLIEHKIFDNLQNQIWALLPGFCTFATDFNESFKSMARCLGETLEQCADLRQYVLHALRRLVHRNSDENKIVMGRYAKNYLPIMFNIYTTEVKSEKDPIRQSLIDTVKFFLNTADSDLINTYIVQAIKNFEINCKLHEEAVLKSAASAAIDINNNYKNTNNGTAAGPKVRFDFDKMPEKGKAKQQEKPANQTLDNYSFAKYSFLDLIAVLARYANDKTIAVIYDLAIQGIENKQLDKTVQKKSYKVFDSILSSGKQQPEKDAAKQNKFIHDFVKTRFDAISNKFIKSLSECNVAAKVPRLKCLLDLMDYIDSSEQKIFLRHILPEVILCIKEINHKSREASFLLLNSMLKCWQKLSSAPEVDSMNEFMHLVMVGLAGSTNMVNCTCLALASLSLEYKENISGSLINDLIETACLLTKSDQKEVILSSLNLLKILISIFNQQMLAPYLEKIADSVHGLHEKRHVATNDPNNSYFAPFAKSSQIRQFIKVILKKLIKKFSFEIVFEKVFKNEMKSNSLNAETMMIQSEENTNKMLTGSVRQSLENLLANLRKSIDKDKKRKEEKEKEKERSSDKKADLISMYTTKTQQTAKTSYNEVEDLLKESSDEEEEDETKSKKTNKDAASRRNKKKSNDSTAAAAAWLQENENDDPLDLLDPMAIKRVMATKPLSKEELERKKSKESKNRGFNLDKKTGKLVIKDDEDEEDTSSESDDDMKSRKSKKTTKSVKKAGMSEDLDEMMDTLSLSKKSQASKKNTKKRSIDDGDSDDDSDGKSTKFSYKPGGSGIHRKLDATKTEYGKEYRSKKATGDIKIKNKPDPYAYIPLNAAKLNKRKRAKLQGEFKGIVKAARKGAANASASRNKIKRL